MRGESMKILKKIWVVSPLFPKIIILYIYDWFVLNKLYRIIDYLQDWYEQGLIVFLKPILTLISQFVSSWYI